MPLWEAALLGVIQGLTEFLPISSTAHLVVARQLLGHDNPNDAFTTVIQLGTLAAVVSYFRTDIRTLGRAVLADFRRRRLASSPESRMAWLIVLGTVPVVVVGGLYGRQLKETFYKLDVMAWVAVVFAALMAAAELWARRRIRSGRPELPEDRVGWREALWVGAWQALALMPGASRSGATITAGLFAGLSRAAAARFSFLLSLPSVLAAGVKDLYDERETLLGSADQALPLLVGLVVSGVVGYLAIAWLLHFLKRYSTFVFVAYRLALAGVILLLLVANVLRQ
jgi:undecaprenyl-diphosphatase